MLIALRRSSFQDRELVEGGTDPGHERAGTHAHAQEHHWNRHAERQRARAGRSRVVYRVAEAGQGAERRIRCQRADRGGNRPFQSGEYVYR